MFQSSTYNCQCGAVFQGDTAAIPPGWDWRGGRLACGDCCKDLPPEGAAPVRCAETTRANPRGVANIDPNAETSILLLSGAYLDLADPDCSAIAPIDIAAGLRQPRFSAQTAQFYTVAQHSLLVMDLVEPAAGQIGGHKGDELPRCALMHDAAEAFIHDITRPLKLQIPDYRRIEARLETRLATAFGWRWTDWRRDQVKRADLQALAIEKRDLIGRSAPWPILQGIDRARLQDFAIARCWHPDEAQERFLTAFETLFPTNERKAA